MGLEKEIGTIEIGKKADIVFLDLSEFRMNCILVDDNAERILDIVLQESTSQQVSDVMINGEFYVREGHILTYSEEDLAKEGQEIFKRLLSFRDREAETLPSPATILQFSENQKDKSKTSADDRIVEEGFKVVGKERSVPIPLVKSTVSHEKDKQPPKSNTKIYGDDDV